jgi:hypothetical protein
MMLLNDAVRAFVASDKFRCYPLKVRDSFQSVANWLPDREGTLALTHIRARDARRLRDRGALQRGYRFGNCAVVLVKAVVLWAIAEGYLVKNRVGNVPRLPPTRPINYRERRRIRPSGGIVHPNRQCSRPDASSRRDSDLNHS